MNSVDKSIDIANIPLSMPYKENIYRKPSYPYEYPTHGILRGKEFNTLLNILVEYYADSVSLYDQLEEHLGHHVIKDTFPNWDFQELCDFSRHVLKINQDGIGWDIADEVTLELNHIAIPGWRIPNFDFVADFRNTMGQVKKIYFSESSQDLMRSLFEQSKIEEIQLDKELKVHLNLWTIRDLWLLLSYLVQIEKSKEEFEGVFPLINHVSSEFEYMIRDQINIKTKICLTLLYIDGIDGLTKEFTMRSKELIDDVWEDIKELPYSEKISFKYLLGAAYSLVGDHLFRQDTDFVTRKLFIDNFIQNYVSEDYDLGRWFADLLDYNMDELIFDLLIRGYAKTVPLLHNHAQELPKSETLDTILTRVKQFNQILAEMLLFHLSIPDDPDHIHLLDALDLFPKKLTFDKTRLNMLELIYQVTSNSAIYNRDMGPNRKLQLYAATFYLLSSYFDRERAFIFEMDYKLNSRTYEFDKIFELIELEVEQTGSLVLSQTFEIEIIKKVSSAIAYADKIQTRDPFFLDIYEIVLQFILEWLSYFSKNESNFKEVLLLSSPMVNICFYQQIRWYYENNFSKKAFLMNLNLHSFMNYFSQRLDRFEQMNFERIVLHEQKGIAEKYRELTQRWQIHDLLKQIQIKEIIIDARTKFKESGFAQKRYTGNLVEDALIHGYLDEINRLEWFVATDFSTKETGNLEKLLLDSGIFKFGSYDSTYRLERLVPRNESEIIPIPLFNNVHRLSVATELFQIQDPGIESIEARNRRIQEKFAKSM